MLLVSSFRKEIAFLLLLFLLAFFFNYSILKSVVIVLYAGYLYLVYKKQEWACWVAVFLLPVTRLPGAGQWVNFWQYLFLWPLLIRWFAGRFQTSSIKDSWHSLPLKFFLLIFSSLLLATTLLAEEYLNIKPLLSHVTSFAFLIYFYDSLKTQVIDSKKLLVVLVLTALSQAGLALVQFAMFHWNALPSLQQYLLPSVSREQLSADSSMAGYRCMGTFYSPNMMGIFLATVFPMALTLFFLSENRNEKILMSVFSVIVFIGIVLSDSRGAVINILVSGFLMMIFNWRLVPKKTFFFVLISFMSLVMLFLHPLESYWRVSGGLSYRDIIWKNAMELFKEHPIQGWGIGSVPQLSLNRFGFPSDEDLDISLDQIVTDGNLESLTGLHAHNLFLNYAVELGIFSIVLIFYFYGLCFKSFFNFLKLRAYESDKEKLLAIGCISALAGNFIHSFVEAFTGFYFLTTGVTLSAILALFFYCFKHSKDVMHAQESII